MTLSRCLAPLLIASLINACELPENPKDDAVDTGDTSDSGEDDTGDPPAGCIQVNGGGGYASLNDALAEAPEGATLTICAGSFEEAVVVEKSVTILGAGRGATLWTAPANHDVFDLRNAASIHLSGLSIQNARSGILVGSTRDTVLSDLAVENMSSKGIDAARTTGLAIREVDIRGCGEGGLLVEAGSFQLEDSVLADNTRFGVKVTEGALGTLARNEIRRTRASAKGGKEPLEDGHGVWGKGAGAMDFEGNTFSGNALSGVFHEEGTGGLRFVNDTIEGLDAESKQQSLVGIYQLSGDLHIEGVRIENPSEFGILHASLEDVIFDATNLTIRGDPALVADLSWEEIVGTESVIGSVGLLVQASTIRLRSSTVEGYNDWGAYLLAPDEETGGTAELEDVAFVDNGRNGLRTTFLDVEARNVAVTGLREITPPTFADIYVDIQGAVLVNGGSLSWDRGRIEGSEGWGISGAFTTLAISDSDFSGCERSAVMDFYGSSVIEGSRFTAAASGETYYTVWAYFSEGMSLTSNTFEANVGDVSVYAAPYYNLYHGYGMDIGSFASRISVLSNTFLDGDRGLLLASSLAEVQDNLWSNYMGYAVQHVVLTGAESNPTQLTMLDNTIEDLGGNAFVCFGTTAKRPTFVIDGLDVIEQGRTVYAYDVYTAAGEYLISGSVDTIPYNLYFQSCDGEISWLRALGGVGPGFYAYDASLVVNDSEISDVNREMSSADYAAQLTWSTRALSFSSSNLSISSIDVSGGMRVQQGYSGSAGLTLDGLSIQDTNGIGLYLVSLTAGTFSGLNISGNASHGLQSSSSSYGVTDSTFAENVGNGVYVSSGTVSVASSALHDNGSNGFLLTAGTATLTSNVVYGNASSGITGTSGSLTAVDNEVYENSRFGMSCGTSLSVGACSNTVWGNSLSDLDSCPSSCDTL
jgi:hypothetical protein